MTSQEPFEEKMNRAAKAIGRVPSVADEVMARIGRTRPAEESNAERIKHKTIKQRIFTMNRLPKIAAAIVILAGIAGLVWVLAGPGTATVAWADVQEKIRNARAATYRVTVQQRGLPEMEMKVMWMEPGLMRQEMVKPQKSVVIMDTHKGTILTLLADQKKALLTEMTGWPEEARKLKLEDRNMLARMKKLIEESETELGEKDIDGRRAKGYKVKKGSQVLTVWADARTGEPIRMEAEFFSGQMRAKMTDFEFGKELDRKLFSMEVPAGYALEKRTVEFRKPSAEDVAEMLRVWAKARGGTFPNALSPSEFVKECKDVDLGGAEGTAKVALGLGLLQLSPNHYAGKGVKLGDAETAILWYKPKDSETYKVIYGDLSIKEVAEEDLPAQPDQAEPDAAAGTD